MNDSLFKAAQDELVGSAGLSEFKSAPPGQPLMLTLNDPARLNQLSARASALVFEDPKSRELLAYLHKIAPSEVPVLIGGETGTGKELLARHIHALSARSQGPFVAVNCAAFTETLLDAELFGHRKGAFTGADQDRAGWFETAYGGTLFLDEVGDLSAAGQAKLLRVLQEREVVRVGARKPVAVDFRLVAATNVNLKAAVEAGNFRADLYYRLSVAELVLPPLRQRPGDILPLVKHFLKVYGNRLGYQEITLEPPAIERLCRHPWPGNIRELENVIHHTLLICPGRNIRAEDVYLPERPRLGEAEADSPAAPEAQLQAALLTWLEQGRPDLYAHVEHLMIDTAYRFSAGNQVQAARVLGISRNTMRERLQRLGVIPYPPSRAPKRAG
jgi:sigma-54-specific transcriptional regulator